MQAAPHFSALIRFLPADQGGLSTPAPTGFQPAIRFERISGSSPAEIMYEDEVEQAYAGDRLNARLILVHTDPFMGRLYAGLSFQFFEGGRLIGTGMVLEVFNAELLAS